MSLANYVSVALMLALFGGVVFFLFRRRSRWSKIATGTPAVLQPRPDATSASLPSTLSDDIRPSWFRDKPPGTREQRSDEHRPSPPAPAPRTSRASPIVELHFMPEPKNEDESTPSAPLIDAFTEADVPEGKTGWPASA